MTDEMPEEKLLPCPFCGDHAKLGDSWCSLPGEKTDHWYCVSCSNCHIGTVKFPKIDIAVSRWNKRTNLPTSKKHAKILEELQDLRAELAVSDATRDLMRRIIEKYRKALELLAPFKIVRGDTMKRTNPHATRNLNTNEAWAVSQPARSAHSLRRAVDDLNAALALTAKEVEND